MSRDFAPIVLFVYNRPLHTMQTIQALQKNTLAKESELFIFSDAEKSNTDRQSVEEVRRCINLVDGFKKVTVIERHTNFGLANSIINGVTTVVNQYGRVIVLEDDLLTSPYFLKFMNDALDFYQPNKEVWHISGWNYPISSDGLNDTFLWRVMNCWGWATWADRWSSFEKKPKHIIQTFTKENICKFNLDGCEDFYGQVLANERREIDTWAIFWYATIFKHNGLCLNPVKPFVTNIGIDGSGVNCKKQKSHEYEINTNETVIFTTSIFENTKHVDHIKKLFTRSGASNFLVKLLWNSRSTT